MNAKNLYHYTNLADYTNSEYTKDDVKGSISIDSSIDNQAKQSLSQRSFLLCESYFWCASQSSNCNTYNLITKCPSCKSNQIESIPISQWSLQL